MKKRFFFFDIDDPHIHHILVHLVETRYHVLVYPLFGLSCLLQHLLQHLVLLPQNADQLVHVGFVYYCLVLDLFCTACVAEG
jgi:hypothetical protein